MTKRVPVEQPRVRIMSAAEDRFRRFGYRRATVDDITRHAGTGKGSLYLHFDSKQDVYLAVVEESLERFVAVASAALQGEGSVPRRLRRLVALTAKHYGDDELLRASLFGGADLVDGDVSRLAAAIQRDRIRSLLEEVLRLGQADGTVRSDIDPSAAAAVVFEIGWAIVRAELEGESDLPLEVALNTLNDIVGLGLLPRH